MWNDKQVNRKLYSILLMVFCWFVLPATGAAQRSPGTVYDVVIYGATSGGISAAIQCSRMGKTVLLIEPSHRIGGLTTGGLGQTDIGNKFAIGGIAREFYRNIKKYYDSQHISWKTDTDAMWHFEPSVALKVFKSMMASEKIDLVYAERLRRQEAVQKQRKKITRIFMESGAVYRGKVFIDASYEGDLMAAAGVSFMLGREDNREYSENWNGVYLPGYRQASGFHQFPDGVDPYVIPGQPRSGLLWGISADTLLPRGAGDRKIQAYNFRICLTDSAENRIPVTRPEDYDSTRYELLARLFEAQPDQRDIQSYFIWSRMPHRKTDINNRGAFSTDMIGANYNWAEGDYREREKIFRAHLSYTKGLLWFYCSDPRVPERLKDFVAAWGYPKDEYTETGHFSPQLYIREGRRLKGEYVMTESNCMGKEKVPDVIGLAAYTMDSHNCQRIVVNGMVKNEGNVEVGGFPPYPIAYRSIVPQRAECTNLLVPFALSATHIAFGSIRMEPVFMVLAQSAAIAASLAIDSRKNIQDVPYRDLRSLLLQYDQYLAPAAGQE